MLDDDDRIVAAQRRIHQADIVEGRGRRDDAPAGIKREQAGRDRPNAASHSRCAARRAPAPRSAPGNRRRTCGAPWRTALKSWSAATRQKSPNMISTIGPQAVEGRAQRHADKAVLGDRHGQHALRPALQRALGGAADAAAQPVHILAHDDDARDRAPWRGRCTSDAAAHEFDRPQSRPAGNPSISRKRSPVSSRQIAADAGCRRSAGSGHRWSGECAAGCCPGLLGQTGGGGCRPPPRRACVERAEIGGDQNAQRLQPLPARWRADRAPAMPSPPRACDSRTRCPGAAPV